MPSYRHYGYTSRPTIGFGRPWTPIVKNLIIINAAVFLFQIFFHKVPFTYYFGLSSRQVFAQFKIWQLFTYMFLHGSALHLLFNMFALWMFGSDVEEYLGSKKFLFYYLYTGVGAGLCVCLADWISGEWSVIIGASGAIFGILLAFGIFFSERVITLLLFLVVPISLKAKHFVILFAIAELIFGVGSTHSGIAHFAHLGGMLFGYLYLKTGFGNIILRYQSIFLRWIQNIKVKQTMQEAEKLNYLLDKIHKQGIHTLSDREKDFLKKMSRKR